MTKKGKGNSNVGKEGLVDTLVILSGDLAQVVAKVSHSYHAMYILWAMHISIRKNNYVLYVHVALYVGSNASCW